MFHTSLPSHLRLAVEVLGCDAQGPGRLQVPLGSRVLRGGHHLHRHRDLLDVRHRLQPHGDQLQVRHLGLLLMSLQGWMLEDRTTSGVQVILHTTNFSNVPISF